MPDHDLRQRLDVGPLGVEVDDAGAQHVAAGDDRVRDEDLAAALQPVEQRSVERVELAARPRRAQRRAQVRAARSGTS